MDEIDEICVQLQPAAPWEKWQEFASFNKYTPSSRDEEKRKAQHRGLVVINRALFLIQDGNWSYPKNVIKSALECIDKGRAEEWSRKQKG